MTDEFESVPDPITEDSAAPEMETVRFVSGPMDGYKPTVPVGAYPDPFEFVTGNGNVTVYKLTEPGVYTAQD